MKNICNRRPHLESRSAAFTSMCFPSAQSPLPSTGNQEACSDAQQIENHSSNHSWALMVSFPQ
jgi:hypothetical protein